MQKIHTYILKVNANGYTDTDHTIVRIPQAGLSASFTSTHLQGNTKTWHLLHRFKNDKLLKCLVYGYQS